MNWAMFSIAGYISVALAVMVPVLWLAHWLRRPRRWLVHMGLVLGVAAFVLAKVNSQFYVSQIQVDHSKRLAALHKKEMNEFAKERARQAAQVHYAEDSSTDALDKGGLSDANMKYLKSIESNKTPSWKNHTAKRSDASGNTGAPRANVDLFNGKQNTGPSGSSYDTKALKKAAPASKPVLMSAADKAMANRWDNANLEAMRLLLLVGVVLLVVDYLKRLNIGREAYFPLPIPSRWADSMTPRRPVAKKSDLPQRTLRDELEFITRRGEVFVLMTADTSLASQVSETMYRLPWKWWPMDVAAVKDDPKMDDRFVFETLWYARGSFVLASPARSQQMLEHFATFLVERRRTRAHARQTVHVVWDMAMPISKSMRERLEPLFEGAGFVLLLWNDDRAKL